MEHVGVEQPHGPNDCNGRCIKILPEKEVEQNELLKICVTSSSPLVTSSGQRQQRSHRGSKIIPQLASLPLFLDAPGSCTAKRGSCQEQHCTTVNEIPK